MKSSLLHDLANVAMADADGIAQPYAWPPRPAMTDEERREVRRLDATARAIRYRAHCAEYEERAEHRLSATSGKDT